MTKSDDAYRCFMSRFTCSAAIFSAFSEGLGLEADTAKKVACGFGAGISNTGNICGAVSGVVMLIGLAYGKTEAGDDAATDRTRALVRQFIQEFTEKNGSVRCTELLGDDLSDPEAYATARESGLFITKCPLLVRDAADIVERLLGIDRAREQHEPDPRLCRFSDYCGLGNVPYHPRAVSCQVI